MKCSIIKGKQYLSQNGTCVESCSGSLAQIDEFTCGIKCGSNQYLEGTKCISCPEGCS